MTESAAMEQCPSPPLPAQAPLQSSFLSWLYRDARRLPLLLAALLMVLTLGLYAPAMGYGFIDFDDAGYAANPHAVSGLRVANIVWAWRDLDSGHWHPLTWLSHMIDGQLYGANPAGHHVTSILLHTANVLLLFLLLHRATRAAGRSFLVAALFAVHPLNVECVAWLSERKTLLCAFFTLLMFAAYGWYVQRPSGRRYAAVAAAFVLASLSKAMAVTMPLALLLADVWPLHRLDLAQPFAMLRGTAARRRIFGLVLEKLPLLAISIASSVMAVVAQHHAGATDNPQPALWAIKNAAVAYTAYLGKALWPAGLTVYYPFSRAALTLPRVALAGALLAAITLLALAWRRRGYLIAGWFYYLLTLLPVLGLVHIGNIARADRYAYTPMIGVYIMAVWGMHELADGRRFARALPALALVAVLALSVAARNTLAYWQSSVALFTRAEALAPEIDPGIEINLGLSYMHAGLPDEAFSHFQLARRVAPRAVMAIYNIGTLEVQRGSLREAVADLSSVVRESVTPTLTESALQNLGTAYLLQSDFARAQQCYNEVLRRNPLRLNAYIGRGRAASALENFPLAAEDFQHAAEISGQPQFLLMAGQAWQSAHRNAQALDVYRSAAQNPATAAEAAARIELLRKDSPQEAH